MYTGWEISFINDCVTIGNDGLFETVPLPIVDVMLFTGKTDTIGNKIFENDLVRYKGKTARVYRSNEKLTLQYKEVFLEQEIPLSSVSGKDLKVVGNIYEGEKQDEQKE